MSVLAILGTTIMAANLADTKHAAFQERKTQAHYLARSGILAGIKMLDEKIDEGALDKKIDEGKTGKVEYIVKLLHEDPALLSSGEAFPEGCFILKFEKYSNNHIKIISEGTVNGNPIVKDTVTYIVRVKPGVYMETNPEKWLSDKNLFHKVTAATNFLGRGVEFNLNPLQLPQGSNEEPTFQASLIYFNKGYKDADTEVSLRQIDGTCATTFDAEIFYFESDVELSKRREPTWKKAGNDINLMVSSTVLNERASYGGVLDAYPEAVGFENYERYKNFIQGYSKDMHSKYDFIPNYYYGLVRFIGSVKNSLGHVVIEPGCYFFPSPKTDVSYVNLQDTNVRKKLIKINDDDAIIKAIDAYYTDSRTGYIWNDK